MRWGLECISKPAFSIKAGSAPGPLRRIHVLREILCAKVPGYSCRRSISPTPASALIRLKFAFRHGRKLGDMDLRAEKTNGPNCRDGDGGQGAAFLFRTLRRSPHPTHCPLYFSLRIRRCCFRRRSPRPPAETNPTSRRRHFFPCILQPHLRGNEEERRPGARGISRPRNSGAM